MKLLAVALIGAPVAFLATLDHWVHPVVIVAAVSVAIAGMMWLYDEVTGN